MRRLAFILLTLALAACSMGGKSEIQQNREKWQNARIGHYRFNLFVGCFCSFTQDMPLLIEVQDGAIVSMAYQSGKEIDASVRDLFEKYGTIDRVFAELEKDLAGEADAVTVTYDPAYGFPTDVNIDFIKNAADDELTLSLSNFEKVP
jgi:hypothetical protein